MAESKGALIAKSVQKHAGRAKEKLLQNLGKVDRTLDDIFEEHLQNFNRQQQQAARLQKEFNNYIRCIRAVQTASKSLMEAIAEVYESGWAGHDLLYVQAQNMEMLWQDFSHKLGDQVLIPLNTYTNQFPETRKKIEKRGRKLVDYDSQRHSFQNLQASAAKRRDDVKITRGREQLEEARRTYEALNSELHDELPALHDSRVLFHVANLQTLFAAEQTFHAESAKVFSELEAITDKLATDSQRGTYRRPAVPAAGAPAANGTGTGPAPAAGAGSPAQSVQLVAPAPATNGGSPAGSGAGSRPGTPASAAPSAGDSPAASPRGSPPRSPATNGTGPAPEPAAPARTAAATAAAADDDEDKKVEALYDIPKDGRAEASPVPPEKPGKEPGRPRAARDDLYDIPVGATLANLPAGVLYRVRATYRYTQEDADELSFDVGELIRVVEYDDPEEQEEGWLMGIKESTNEKGMFPANFTRPI